MKKLHFLVAALILAGSALTAQNVALPPQGAPCSTFENPNPAGNWITTDCSASYTGSNPLDGSQCVILSDQSGGSWYTNSVDYNNLGRNYLNQCICFDYFLKDDGDPGTVSFNPTIYLSDGVNTIAFVSATAVTEGSGWIHVCAPIQHCTGSTLPSNTDGAWTMAAGLTCTDFNNVLDNVTSVSFPTDINSCPCEVMLIDNVCVKNCNNCQTAFKLAVTFNSDGSSTADVFLNTTDPSATYQVDWGDLTPPSTLFVSHLYRRPGSYNVCVTEYINRVVVCRTCMTFCYKGEVQDGGGDGGGGVTPTDPTSRLAATPSAPMRTLTDNKFNNEGFTIFPNPSKDFAEVQISLSKKEQVTIKVIDMYGKVVAETVGNYDLGGQKIKLNTEKLNTGIYTVEINIGGKMSTQKLSVSK